jgi:hypothetical protein
VLNVYANVGRTDFRNASQTRCEGLELAWRQRFAGGFETAVAWTALDAPFQQPFVSGRLRRPCPQDDRCPRPPRQPRARVMPRHAPG